MRVLRIVLGVFAGVLVIAFVGALFGNLGDRLILWPTTNPIPAGRAQRRGIALGDGRICEAWIVPARAAPRRYVLRFYGNADRAERWIDEETASWPADVEGWGINYPGYGTTGGKATLAGVADAALAAYDEIANQARGAPIYVFGTSLGTTAALHLAAERKVAGLVLFNPPPLKQLIVGDHGWWNLWIAAAVVAAQIPEGLDSLANARRAHAPAIFVLSQRDQIVRHRYHLLVRDAYAGAKDVILRPEAGHNDPLAGPELIRYREAVARLFARTPS